MRTILEIIGTAVVVGLAGGAVGYLVRKNVAEGKIATAEEQAIRIVQDAEQTGEAKRKEIMMEAKEEIHRLRSEMERENKDRRNDLQRQERRLLQKEENLDRKIESFERKEEKLASKEQRLNAAQEKADAMLEKRQVELERISGLTSDEAKQELLQSLEDEVKHESAMMVKDLEQQAKDEADRKAREIISLAIQRCAADHVAETTVSVVGLPNDEMKGRIIGREGRNIRTLETLTGIDLIIDDTPEAVIISGFDPVRREVARIALEKLINDGRIHPSRIEEMVEKAQKEVEQKIKEAGEQATFAVGVHGLHPELIKLLGRLKYRTSYGQNVLNHSVEVANLAGVMASELGVDVVLAKRAGLLHDIGKAIDHEMEGSHVEIGGEIAKKFRESDLIVNAILAHHGDCEPKSVEAVLVSAADAVSAARPGARRETLESYLKRLTRLEEISESFEGVEKCYAVQAGREIRIMVKPDVIDDASAVLLARDISKKIEAEMEYPGQIIKLSAYDKPASLGVTITKRGNAQVMAGQSMRYDLTVANTSNVPLESFFWHDKIPYDVARPTTLTTGTYSARLNYRILYKTNCNTSYQVLASNLLSSNNYSFALNAIPMQAGEVVTDIYFDFGTVPVGFQSVANPTLSVMVKGMAVNGYQMVNRADVGGKYQGTWQTATASWVKIIRRLWNTPTLPKTGY